ncbi:hypothetical protein ACHWUR_01885 [Klebsiella pneumoniae]
MPDCKELNETKRMEKAAQDLAIAGMWIAEDDGVLNPRTVKVGPRRIIVANSTESMETVANRRRFQCGIYRRRTPAGVYPQNHDGRSAATAGRPGDDRN